MQWVKQNRKRLVCTGLLVLIVLQLGLIAFYQYAYFFTSAAMDSDAASELLLARHLYEEGRWFVSASWYYSTEVRVFHNQIVMRILFIFTQNYRLVFALCAVIVAALAAASVVFCLRGAGISWQTALLGALLCIVPYGAGLHMSYFSLFYGVGYYGFFLIGVFVQLGLVLHAKRAGGTKRALYLCASALFALLLGMCGTRYALILFLPLMLAQLGEVCLREGKGPMGAGYPEAVGNGVKRALAAIASLVGYMTGLLVYTKVLAKGLGSGQMHMSYQTANQSDLVLGLQLMWSNAVQLTGYIPERGALLSLIGISSVLGLVYTLLALVCGGLMLYRVRRLSKGLRFYTLFAWCAFLFNAFGMLMLYENNIIRYTWLGMLAFLPMPAVYLFGKTGRLHIRKLGIGAVCGAVFLTMNFQLVNLHYPYESGAAQRYGSDIFFGEYVSAHYGERSGYLDFLQGAGYVYGAADFWDANVTTVLLNGETVVTGVDGAVDGFVVRPWLTSKQPIAERMPEFLLISQAGLENRENWEQYIPENVVYYDDYYVVFDLAGEDLATVMRDPVP